MTRMRSEDERLARKSSLLVALATAVGVTASVMVIRVTIPVLLTLIYR